MNTPTHSEKQTPLAFSDKFLQSGRTLLTPGRRLGLSRKSPNTPLCRKIPEENTPVKNGEGNKEKSQTPTLGPLIECKEQHIGGTLLTPGRTLGLCRKFVNSPLVRQVNAKISKPVKIQFNDDEDNIDEKTQKDECVAEKRKGLDTEESPVVSTKIRRLDTFSNSENKLGSEKLINDHLSSSTECEKEKTNITVPEIVTSSMIDSLTMDVKHKYQEVKSAELSNIYSKKHNLEVLKGLTLKWKVGCQEVLRELQTTLANKGSTLSMTELMAQFKIPHDFLGYNEENEDFE